MRHVGGHIDFDSKVIEAKEIDGRIIVKCAPAIYELKENKHGKMYKVCLTKGYRSKEKERLIQAMDESYVR